MSRMKWVVPSLWRKNLLYESRSLKGLTLTEINDCWEAVYLWGSRTKHLVLCTNYRLCAIHTYTHPHTLSHHRLNCKLSTPNRNEIKCLKKGYSLNLFLRCLMLCPQDMSDVCCLSLSIYTVKYVLSLISPTPVLERMMYSATLTYSILIYF